MKGDKKISKNNLEDFFPEENYCPYCRTHLSFTETICPYCGTNLVKTGNRKSLEEFSARKQKKIIRKKGMEALEKRLNKIKFIVVQ